MNTMNTARTASATTRITTRITTRVSTRATALSLAALFTLATLGSINLLATQPSPDQQMAASSAPVQVIVITGKRLHA